MLRSVPQLVTWLQLHLDVPELAALEVQGNKVHVRHGGRTVPIEVAAPPPAVTVPPVAAQPQQPAQPAATPPPPQPMPPPNPAPPSHATPPAPAPNPTPGGDAKPDEKKDESNPASRFSWLEVD